MARLLQLVVRTILGIALVTSGALGAIRSADHPSDQPGLGSQSAGGATTPATTASATTATCPYPGEISGVAFGPGKQTISWGAAGNAVDYDVVRGSIGAFPVGPQGGDEVCFDDIVGTSTTDAAVPATGQGFWYLVRGESSCVSGTYGTKRDGTPRFTTTCPPKAPPDADTFLYVAGHFQDGANPPGGQMTFDGITFTRNLEAMSMWLTKVDLATHLSVWATKIVEGLDAEETSVAGPFIASDRATGAIYVQIGDLRGGSGFAHPFLVYDATSNTAVKATLTRTHSRQQYLIKYDKNGVYQWARTFRSGTNPLNNFITEVRRQNVSVLPNGNIVVGVIAEVPSNWTLPLSLNDETGGATQLASVATFQILPEAEHGAGALVVLDPAGNFVASTVSDVLASGGGELYSSFEPRFALSRYTSHGIASGMHEHQSLSNSITVALDGGTFTNTHTAAGTEYKAAVAKYDTSLGFAWTADDTEEPSGNLANATDLTAVELGDDGSVYSVGAAGPYSPAQVTSRSAGWTTPQMTSFQDSAYIVYQSYYNKRSASGVILWSHSFLPGSVMDTQLGFQRYIGDIAVVNGAPWIAGFQRHRDLIKFPGLPDMDSANVPGGRVRGWLVKLDPSTGLGEYVTKVLWNPIFPTHQDPWQVYENDLGVGLRLIPLDVTRLAVGFRSIIQFGSIVLGRGEGNETIFTATAGGETVAVIAVYDAPSGGLYFVKTLPTSWQGETVHIIGLAGSPF